MGRLLRLSTTCHGSGTPTDKQRDESERTASPMASPVPRNVCEQYHDGDVAPAMRRGVRKDEEGDWREGTVGYDGMRQPIKPLLRARWVYIAFCRVVLVLDRTQSPFKTTKTATTATATVDARLASPLCFSPATVARVMPQWFACPISIPSFAHTRVSSECLNPPQTKTGIETKKGETRYMRHRANAFPLRYWLEPDTEVARRGRFGRRPRDNRRLDVN